MGNTCCKKPEEEMVLETFETNTNNQNNINENLNNENNVDINLDLNNENGNENENENENENIIVENKIEDINQEVKDRYPHDSDSAFKPKKHEELKENMKAIHQGVEPILDENENENENSNEQDSNL